MKTVTTVSVAVFLICGSIPAQEPEPLGEEFQVNSYVGIWQSLGWVAADPQGNFVVTWSTIGSPGNDTDHSVQAQRFDGSGSMVGSQFQVNSYTTSGQVPRGIAVDSQGNFVVVWQSDGSYGSDDASGSIQAQRYEASATPIGSQFQVNSYTSGNERGSAVAMDAQGSFVVIWQGHGYGTESNYGAIQGQVYDSNGLPVGSQFQVNTYTTGLSRFPNVAGDAQGTFVVVWNHRSPYGWPPPPEYSIRARRFDSAGAPLGDDFQVNSYTTGYQSGPAVATDPQGDFVVVWQSYGSYGTDTSYGSIQGQRYDSEGNLVGGQFQVNTYTTSYQSGADVAADAQGNFVVVWSSSGSYTEPIYPSVQAQLHNSSGAPVGGQFQVNTPESFYEAGGRIAMDGQSSFVVVWGQGTIWGQRFSMSLVFADGFESGDFGDWIVFP